MFKIWECVGCELSFEPEELSINRDEIALCRSCLTKLKANGKIRNCPGDGTPMDKKSVYHLLPVDKCPSCGGVWLESYAVKVIGKIIQAMKEKGIGEGFILGWHY